MRRRVFVTGASGFIGSALCRSLSESGHQVVAIVRPGTRPGDAPAKCVLESNIAGADCMPAIGREIEVVFHLAGRAHVLHETAIDPAREFYANNVTATVRLAEEAARAGVRRFVFVSSAGVLGFSSAAVGSFTDGHDPKPYDLYTGSKFQAELALRRVCAQHGMDFVILRPPVVVGPGVKGNFLRFLRVIDRSLPLPPFETVRSMIGLRNLVNALEISAVHSGLKNGTFLVADPEALSFEDLARRVASLLGRHLWMPRGLEKILAGLARRVPQCMTLRNLTNPFTLDISGFRTAVDWHPPVATGDELARTVQWFASTNHSVS